MVLNFGFSERKATFLIRIIGWFLKKDSTLQANFLNLMDLPKTGQNFEEKADHKTWLLGIKQEKRSAHLDFRNFPLSDLLLVT